MQEDVLDESHQPPLYYLLAAIATLPQNISDEQGKFRSNPDFVWAGRGGADINANIGGTAQTFPFQGEARALHLARLASVFMGAVTVWLTIEIGWLIFPNQMSVALLAGGLVAFNPQFLFISGAVNNDNLLITAVTGAVWQTLRLVQRPKQWKQWGYLGLWLSVAMLTKLTGIAVVLAVAVIIVSLAYRQQNREFIFVGGGIITTIMLVFVGWWFVRNQIVSGDLLGMTKYEQSYFVNLRSSPLLWADIQEWLRVQFRSFWGIFGWMTVAAPDWYFTLVRLLLATAVVGWIVLLAQKIIHKWSPYQKASIGFLALVVVLQQLVILFMLTRCNASCYQGRYLFPAISAIAAITAIGLLNLSPNRAKTGVAATIVAVLVGLALFMALFVIEPAYTMSPLPAWKLMAVQHKSDTLFGNKLVLRGYNIETGDSTAAVQLYWQSIQKIDFDYSAFVHLIDKSGSVIAQKDTGIGQTQNYLPTAWAAGDMVADEHVIPLPPDLPPGVYQIRAGVYNWISGERLLTEENDDFIVLSEITIPDQ